MSDQQNYTQYYSQKSKEKLAQSMPGITRWIINGVYAAMSAAVNLIKTMIRMFLGR